MRLTWNGTDVDHSTFVYYDEISAVPHGQLRRDPFGNIGEGSGALVCRDAIFGTQRFYMADGTRTDDSYGVYRLNTYYTRDSTQPYYARLNRRKKEYPGTTPRYRENTGLWSCRRSESAFFAAAFVAVYERELWRSKLDGGLRTGKFI